MGRIIESRETNLRRGRFRWPTLIESLLVIAIVAVLVALIVPSAQWASSGFLRAPVRVIVFDAASGEPIANARVAVFRAEPLSETNTSPVENRRYDVRLSPLISDTNRGVTGADGMAVIEHEFRTGANHDRPMPHVHLTWAWVEVRAEGYGGLVVPVRHETLPVESVRTQGELVVPIGLLPIP